jgi:predicted MPP superfamily phosphohydrolase
VPIAHLTPRLEGLRILHLTDLHLRGRWPTVYDDVIGRVRADPPDLILFTGDFVDDKSDHRPALPHLQRFVQQLTARVGIFAVTGNHDGDLLGPRLAGWGIGLINRRRVELRQDRDDSAAIELIGLPGVKRTSFDSEFLAEIPQRRPGVPRIVMGHFPDQVQRIGRLQADLMLAGHTHGGQICLPNGMPLVTHDTLPRRMATGAHRIGQTLLVVNRGLGTSLCAVRVFCPAEVIELRLTGR